MQAKTQLLNLLQKAIKNNQLFMAKILLDAIVRIDVYEKTAYYYEFSDVATSDNRYKFQNN